MTYKAKMWTEDGEVLCCSTMCDADGGCERICLCKEVEIEVKEVKELEVAS